ncbi:hypothetical protein Btru_002857, partial [Bulinus truncatus]
NDEKQSRLREQAKKLIAETRANEKLPELPVTYQRTANISDLPSPGKKILEPSLKKLTLTTPKLSDLPAVVVKETELDDKGQSSDDEDDTLDLHFTDENLQDTNQYVKSELDSLEHEQLQIDAKASELESRLRNVMEKGRYRRRRCPRNDIFVISPLNYGE